MALTEDDVRRIATYTRIDLTPEQLSQMTIDLNEIIESLDAIGKYDLEGVEPTFHPIGGLVNDMREDEPHPGFTQKVALSNAGAVQDGAFLIPTILGGGDAS